jgi:hypothetical protein
MLGVLVGLSFLMPVAAMQPQAVAAKGSCTGWQSKLVPPDTIRVYRRATGVVEVVPFPTYVVTVAAKEWPGYLPLPVIEAGTLAVKQYGWFYAMEGHHRSSYVTDSGECYDVRDTTADQLYKPAKANITSKHHAALDKTWDFSLRKNFKWFLTGYRTGNKGPCASDATGWKLFARTATRCANDLGYDWLQILDAYYSPNLQIVRSDGTILGVDGQPIGDLGIIGSTLPADGSTTRFDERVEAVELNGDWQRAKKKSAYKHTLTYSSDQSASMDFQVAGTGLEIIGRKGPKRGRLKVFVDGDLKETVDTYASSGKNQQVLVSWQWSTDKVRDIRLELDGPSSRPRVDIDAIAVTR